jgi:hypothetical protein
MKYFPLKLSSTSGSDTYYALDPLSSPLDIGTWRGVVLLANYVVAMGTYECRLEAYDPSSQTWGELVAKSGLTGSGTCVLQVHPELTPVANATASVAIPNRWRAVVIASGATPAATFTLAARMLP